MSETVQWIDPFGVATTLDVEWAVSGRFMPPTAFESDGVPGQDGERFRFVRYAASQVILPTWVTGNDEITLRSGIRSLAKSMNPKNGLGRIRVIGPDGSGRDLYCRYISGFEGDETLGQSSGPQSQRLPLVFRASDPLWYDSSPTVSTFTNGGFVPFFPIFPIRLASSAVFSDGTVVNNGDESCFPVWTIQGPGSDIYLINQTTGYALHLVYTLGVGESVTIDTRPGAKTVTKNDGTNLFPNLSNDSAMWSLAAGPNAVRIQMPSSTTASFVQLSATYRYLTV